MTIMLYGAIFIWVQAAFILQLHVGSKQGAELWIFMYLWEVLL